MDIEKIIKVEEEALRQRQEDINKYLELMGQANLQLKEQLKDGYMITKIYRAATMRAKHPLPGLETTLPDFLISVLIGVIIVAVATVYYGSADPPKCPPLRPAGTLDNPLHDRNWKVWKCPDKRLPLDRIVKPIMGVYR